MGFLETPPDPAGPSDGKVNGAGITVPYGDEEAVVADFRRLVENDAERADLGGRARRRIAELFNAEQ